MEGAADGAGQAVGFAAKTHDVGQVRTRFGRRTHDFEDGEVARDAAAFIRFRRRGAGDVVRHQDVFHLDPLGGEPFAGHAEIQHIPGVVAIGEHHSAPDSAALATA